MYLTRMEFEHFWDTPPNNLLSRLKHRGGGMLKIVILLCAQCARSLEHFTTPGVG